MPVPNDIVGQFVDAAVDDHARADRLLMQYPDLKSSRWCGESILRFVAIENFPAGVRFLASRGWLIDERDEGGTTTLHDAIRAGAGEAVLALLDVGANPNAESETYDTPLHCAISSGNAALVQALIKVGANPHYVTILGENAYDALPRGHESRNEIRAILSACGVAQTDA